MRSSRWSPLKAAQWKVVFVMAAIAGLAPITRADESRRPNIVFVMADDLGYGDLGCYGQQKIATPNLDRMAAEGVRFTDYYAGACVCAPSRCVLMTGLHGGHCLIRGNSKQNLRPGDVTIAEVLQKAGYASGLFGKWGLGHENSSGLPTMQGFAEFFGYLDQTHAHNYFPTFLIEGRSRRPLNNVVPEEGPVGQGVASERNEYSHDLIFAAALDFIGRHRDQPFFLYLPVTLPHANNEAKDRGMEIPGYGDYADRDWPDPEKGRAAMIGRLDADMALLFSALREHELEENTLVIFTSDNGPHAEGGSDPAFFDSSGPLQGIKRDLYEGGLRVPLIARWPGRIEPGRISAHVASHTDVLATLADLAGAAPPRGLDSLSFLPELLGREGQQTHDFLYWEFYERGRIRKEYTYAQAVRHGDWKAIRYIQDDSTVELYNLAEDLGEDHDVAAGNPEIAAALVRMMDQSHIPSPEWTPKLERIEPPGKRRPAAKAESNP